MTFPEFFRKVKGFEQRQEIEWRRTYRLWAVQVKDPVSFDVFMGRKPVLTVEEKFSELWELVQRDREKGEHAECTAS